MRHKTCREEEAEALEAAAVALGVGGEALEDEEAVAEVAVAFEEAGAVVEEAGRCVMIVSSSFFAYVSAALLAQ